MVSSLDASRFYKKLSEKAVSQNLLPNPANPNALKHGTTERAEAIDMEMEAMFRVNMGGSPWHVGVPNAGFLGLGHDRPVQKCPGVVVDQGARGRLRPQGTHKAQDR